MWTLLVMHPHPTAIPPSLKMDTFIIWRYIHVFYIIFVTKQFILKGMMVRIATVPSNYPFITSSVKVITIWRVPEKIWRHSAAEAKMRQSGATALWGNCPLASMIRHSKAPHHTHSLTKRLIISSHSKTKTSNTWFSIMVLLHVQTLFPVCQHQGCN